MPPDFELRTTCRSCGSESLELVIDFGEVPLADGLLADAVATREENLYPLSVVFCEDCSLVQIRETIPPEVLYSTDYPYFSSFSDELVRHSRANVEDLIDRHRLGRDSTVVEIASNDGYLLQWFVAAGIPALGIDPAPGPVNAARQRGVETICSFFDTDVAAQLVADGISADVIIGNNVLAHVPDQNSLIEAMSDLLAPDGVIVMEFPYVKDLVDNVEFDTIYHEHHCYFSVTSVARLFARHGFVPQRVVPLKIHGGSLRIEFVRSEVLNSEASEWLEAEASAGLDGASYYREFGRRVTRLKADLVALFETVRSTGARVAGYGAAAKATMLLNFCGLGGDIVEFIVDRNTHKQGKLMPGVHVPISHPDRLLADNPEFLLILAWNFKDEIMAQQEPYARNGGQFVIPIPSPQIVKKQVEAQA